MLKLKEVVDRQRDELRAKVQEIGTISKEVEAVRRHRQPEHHDSSTESMVFISHVLLRKSSGGKKKVWNVEAP